MDSNTSTTAALEIGPDRLPVGLDGLASAIGKLDADDLAGLSDAQLAGEAIALRRLADQLEGAWLRRLAAVDARGAGGAELGVRATSTAGWLRATLRLSPAGAGRAVRTARALHHGPLAATARALAHGEVSVEHAVVLAEGTSDAPAAAVAEAEEVLVAAARRLDPGRLRRVTTHLREVIDPDRAADRARSRWERRGLWLSATVEGMVALDGLLDPEAGEALRSALAPSARPAGPEDARSAAQRRADALGELAGQALQGGRLPRAGGLRPQLSVTVELASLLAEQGGVGGTGSWGGLLPGETVRRVACDATVTRAVVRRHHATTGHAGHAGAAGGGHAGAADATDHAARAAQGGGGGPGGSTIGAGGLVARLHQAVALLPAPLGAPTQLLDVGRATRVVGPGLRRALAVRDGGCVAEGCDRPAPWTDAHHLTHWLAGGATSLDNLVLLCRTHHRAVHEGGWRLDHGGGGHTLIPPARHLIPAPAT